MRFQMPVRSIITATTVLAFSIALADDATQPHEFTLPEGFSSQLIAGPPLVTHPTMGCFDDIGRFFVCDGAGVNMSAAELEEHLPNRIQMLEDQDGDGVFDKSTVFADKMTFPMGAAWHDGALYVASPPNIWRLEDTTGDGVADKRDIIVDSFGYTGNAASIHGCFFSPDGRMYWCDGYHGHEFKDDDGNVTSKRKGSYIFSCWPDGSDVRIHCGGGMDNPVEVDFTEEGDVIGTVNILYNRPRADCLVHWQYGGAYPHREEALEELKVTGDVLGPIHNFGHVAVSGTTRYRSGVMDSNWDNNFFVTEFNLGKVVRVELERSGSTYSCTERQFLSCSNRDFRPTDIIEDADGSLVVIDTGGWFYRGCPTSQIAKPDVLGGIYRIRRDDVVAVADPRGNATDWTTRTADQLMLDLGDNRFAFREKAIQECVRRRGKMIDSLARTVGNGDVTARRNAIWALTRLRHASQGELPADAGREKILATILVALRDKDAGIRQAAWHAIGAVRKNLKEELHNASAVNRSRWQDAVQSLFDGEPSAAVRREAWVAVAKTASQPWDLMQLWLSLPDDADREERHSFLFAMLESSGLVEAPGKHFDARSLMQNRGHDHELLVSLDQILKEGLSPLILKLSVEKGATAVVQMAARIAQRQAANAQLSVDDLQELGTLAATRLKTTLRSAKSDQQERLILSLLSAFGDAPDVGRVIASELQSDQADQPSKMAVLRTISKLRPGSLPLYEEWKKPLQELIDSSPSDLQALAVRAVGSIGAQHFSASLLSVVQSTSHPASTRMDALKTLAADRNAIDRDKLFALLLELVTDGSIEEQLTATQLLGTSSVSSGQLGQIAPLLQDAGPGQLVDLVSLFKGSLSPALAVAFLDNIENARSLNSLPTIQVSEVVKRFSPELHARANVLLDRMQAAEQQKLLKLDSLLDQLKTGDPIRGKAVFFSEKTKCSTCHVVGTNDAGEILGKRVGPDLTTIGASRTAKDLLESIIFPSSTIVRQYEPYTLLTADGRTYSGLVLKDTSEEVTIQQTTGDPITVARDDIEELIPGTVSVMPKGLDEELSAQQIADLVAWLQSIR